MVFWGMHLKLQDQDQKWDFLYITFCFAHQGHCDRQEYLSKLVKEVAWKVAWALKVKCALMHIHSCLQDRLGFNCFSWGFGRKCQGHWSALDEATRAQGLTQTVTLVQADWNEGAENETPKAKHATWEGEAASACAERKAGVGGSGETEAALGDVWPVNCIWK